MKRQTTIKELENLVFKFQEARDWTKWNHPKDVAISVCIEAAELLELFQWKNTRTLGNKDEMELDFKEIKQDKIKKISNMRKVLCVGQAYPKPPYPNKPFGRTKLYDWFTQIGIGEDFVDKYFNLTGALCNYFPGVTKTGAHKVPTEKQINNCRPWLKSLLINFKPDIVIPIGKLSAVYALQRKVVNLSGVVGTKFICKPYGLTEKNVVVIPFPHPSGASTWVYDPSNKKRLGQALRLLSQEFWQSITTK